LIQQIRENMDKNKYKFLIPLDPGQKTAFSAIRRVIDTGKEVSSIL